MRSGIALLICVALMLSVSSASAQQSKTTVKDRAPWHVSQVAKLNTFRGGSEANSTTSPQKFLHVKVSFNVPPDRQKKHNFRVVDGHGKEVGELRGWNQARSLVVFEGSWASLNGLYLDGNGHREPLFATKPVAPPLVHTEPVGPATPVVVTPPPVYVERQPFRTTVVPRTTTHVVGPDRVIYEDGGTTRVYHDEDRVVYQGGGTTHVYHDTGRVVDHGGGTTHVYHDEDRVVHHGGGTTHVYDDEDRVVHHGGGTTHVYHHDGDGGDGQGHGPGDGEGRGPGDGEGEGAGPGKGPGSGEDCGPGEGPGEGTGPGKEGPGGDGEGPGPGKGPGSGPGGPGSGPGECGAGGPGECGPGGPGECGPGGPGEYGPGGPGQYGPGRYGPMAGGAIKGLPPKLDAVPAFVLYVATGDETGPGKVYQVNEHGRVLGWVNLPYTPTGLALHRDNGLVVALPRDGGKVMRIDDTGKVSTLLEKDKSLVHPVDVAVGGDSDTVLVADNVGDVMAATSTGGLKPQVYKRFEGQKWTAQDMSVAITNDKHVVFGTNGDKGIYRLSGDEESASSTPLLPGPGGVAADPKSLRWAATQDPSQIYVFEGEELLKKLRLPPNKSIYRNGLLSFSPCGSLCVAARDSDEAIGEPWLLMYNVDEEKTRSLFPWTRETMTDFVVGPRMLWDRKSPNTYKSIY